MTTTRKSPIAHLVADVPAPVQATLHHPVDMVKLGAKGPRLVEWAEQHALALPARMYDTRPVGADGVLARVGTGELILECQPGDELWARLNAALEAAEAGVYRVEQQSVTLVVRGDDAEGILAQACAVEIWLVSQQGGWCTRRWPERLAGCCRAARTGSARTACGSITAWQPICGKRSPPLLRISLAPKRRTEQHQERKNLQPPNQHGKAQNPLGDRIDVAVVVDDLP